MTARPLIRWHSCALDGAGVDRDANVVVCDPLCGPEMGTWQVDAPPQSGLWGWAAPSLADAYAFACILATIVERPDLLTVERAIGHDQRAVCQCGWLSEWTSNSMALGAWVREHSRIAHADEYPVLR